MAEKRAIRRGFHIGLRRLAHVADQERRSKTRNSAQILLKFFAFGGSGPRMRFISGAKRRFVEHLRQDIDARSHLLEMQLLLLALATGIQDAIAFPGFHCFASNQTGNTVIFAVGVLHPRSEPDEVLFSLRTVGMSLGFFVYGVFTSGRLANTWGISARRWWLFCSSMVQMLFLCVCTVLQYRFSEASTADSTLGRVTLACLAFSSGLQVAMVRALKISDITTAMVTAAYIDIFIDPKLFSSLTHNRSRNRRAGFLAILICGSFIGAAGAKTVGSAFALLLSVLVKLFATGLFMYTPAELGTSGPVGDR